RPRAQHEQRDERGLPREEAQPAGPRARRQREGAHQREGEEGRAEEAVGEPAVLQEPEGVDAPREPAQEAVEVGRRRGDAEDGGPRPAGVALAPERDERRRVGDQRVRGDVHGGGAAGGWIRLYFPLTR